MPTLPFRFGPFELDTSSGQLRKGGRQIHLQPQVFQILALLLEHQGDVVTHEELRARLWPAEVHLDFQHGLTKAVNKLREVLGDSRRHPRFIETLSRSGYRFIALVERLPPDRRDREAQGITRLALLPFRNLSSDPQQEYFADGLAEEVPVQLRQLCRFACVVAVLADRYKATHKSIREIGRELGVQYLLKGSIRMAPGRARITMQLIDAQEQLQVWVRCYERETADLLTLQSSVAAEAVHSLIIESPLCRNCAGRIEAPEFLPLP